jgi:hypothetical protein
MALFDKFPKQRIDLPDDYRRIYASHYASNRNGETSAASLSQRMEMWMHRKVAKDVLTCRNKSTLEIGAGTLNQLLYEKTSPYDIVEPFKELYEGSPLLNLVNDIYSDIEDIPADKRYDRITSIATFEHILNLPSVVARTCLIIKNEGVLRVAIPNEGTFLWKLGWKLTTGLEFRLKYNIDYGLLMKYEHVNSAREIEEVLKYFYNNVKGFWFGISKGFAFYRFYECSLPNIDRASDFL